MKFIDEFGGIRKAPERTKPYKPMWGNRLHWLDYFIKKEGGVHHPKFPEMLPIMTREEWPEDYFANKENNLEEHNE